MTIKMIALATALVVGASATAFAQAENENGRSIYVPNYSNGQDAFAQQYRGEVRRPARTLTDSERVWQERPTKDIGAY